MYAIIIAGGKQYKVAENDVLKVELMKEEVGSTVNFKVVMKRLSSRTAKDRKSTFSSISPKRTSVNVKVIVNRIPKLKSRKSTVNSL